MRKFRNNNYNGKKRDEGGYNTSPFKDTNGKGKTYYGFNGRPTKDVDIKLGMAAQAAAGLPKGQYSIKADPYDAQAPGSTPYPLLNRFNSMINGEFYGEDNIDGGNVQQYVSGTNSKFIKSFDYMRFLAKFNYRYLHIEPVDKFNTDPDSKIVDKDGKETNTKVRDRVYWGRANIDEMRKAISETVSILSSTTFTNLAITNFAVITDLPLGSGEKTKIYLNSKKTEFVWGYTNIVDVLYAMSIYYQIFLQNCNNAFMTMNSFRLKMGTMIKNSWNRETSVLNDLFSLYNKAAFLGKLKSVALSFEGEYFDKEFADEIATTCFIPSRRSDSILDPLIELQANFSHPDKFQVVALDSNGYLVGGSLGTSTIYNDTDTRIDMRRGVYKDKSITIWQACDRIRDILNAESTAHWARLVYNQAQDQVNLGIDRLAISRFDELHDLFTGISSAFTIFKPRWADFRECFDTMWRTGAVSWSTGYTPLLTSETSSPTFRNLFVENVLQLAFVGAKNMYYNKRTMRMESYALWRKFEGIPKYDSKTGGIVEALSCKELPEVDYNNLDNSDAVHFLPYLPIAFEAGSDIAICARDGTEAVISVGSYDKFSGADYTLKRLAPLESQSDLAIKFPECNNDLRVYDAYGRSYSQMTGDWDTDPDTGEKSEKEDPDNPGHKEYSILINSTLSESHKSMINYCLTDIFGIACVNSKMSVDSNIISIYQIEYLDTTNDAITYSRAKAPFRATTSTSSVLGFFGLMGHK